MSAAANDQYDELARSYDLLHQDTDDASPGLVRLLQRLKIQPGNTSVLDCACGTASDVAGLFKLGFSVVGSDISESMIEAGRRKLGRLGVAAELVVSSWQTLSSVFKSKFDVVLCCGNSILHSPTSRQLEADIRSMCSVLTDDGRLVIGLSDWRRIPISASTYWVQPATQPSSTCTVPLYAWKTVDESHHATVDILFIHVDGNETHLERHPMHMTLHSVEDVAAAMTECGLHAKTDGDEANPYADHYIIGSRGRMS